MRRKIYFIGIGGIGMSAVAGLAKARGYDVCGSDSGKIYEPSKSILEKYKIVCLPGAAAENIDNAKPDTVVATSAADLTNPEVARALELKIPVLSFPQLLAELTKDKRKIVVVGTHGKSTTSGILGFALKNLNDSSFFVGGVLANTESNFYLGAGPDFVIEGDEYKSSYNDRRPKFLHYSPDILLINNIELDHPDIYPTFEDFKKQFLILAESMPANATIIYNADDPAVIEAVKNACAKKIPFSYSDLKNFNFTARLPGKIYAYDYLGAAKVLQELGFAFKQFKGLLEEFSGIRRRFEIIYDSNSAESRAGGGFTVIDDYAHHPTAVLRTLEAAREKYGRRRIICFFEPHTFSRTKETLPDLAKSFVPADIAYIAEIYSAREQGKDFKISGQDAAAAVSEYNARIGAKTQTFFVENANAAFENYSKIKQPGDVLIIMAVGEFHELAYKIKALATEKVGA